MSDTSKKPIGIIGASGYGGVQLVRLLLEHPQVDIAYLGGDSSAGKQYGANLSSFSPLRRFNRRKDSTWMQLQSVAKQYFLGLPNGLACDIAPALSCQRL